MAVIIMLISLIFSLITLVCAVMVLINAFQISVAKGFMVLCIPFYIFIFVWSEEFQHPRKAQLKQGLIVGVSGNILMNILARVLA